ncbi:hypothetical protein [Streptomyces sp. NPDC090445]|uniref:hypothetical protein n=1 Tax=Streptomyces sp. NPDC090445 TaxID=3365963 RepID=UPI00381809A8
MTALPSVAPGPALPTVIALGPPGEVALVRLLDRQGGFRGTQGGRVARRGLVGRPVFAVPAATGTGAMFWNSSRVIAPFLFWKKALLSISALSRPWSE